MAENVTTDTTATTTADSSAKDTQTANATSSQTDTEFERRVQAEKDRAVAEYGKKVADLQKQLEEIQKEKMSADERKKFDDEKKAKEIAEKDRLLTERENRLTAIDELTKAKLYDGGEKSTAFVNIVIKGKDANEIAENVKAVKAYIDEQVAKGVDETFKAGGRTPNGGNSTNVDKENKNDFAAQLGKKTAETTKQSNDILNHYIGGNN